MSCNRGRRTVVRRSNRRNAVLRPSNTRLAMLVIDQVAAPALTAVDLAKQVDRDWFRSHPQRSHRLRRAIPGEIPGGSAETWVVVRQLQPGARRRCSFDATVEFPSDEAPEHIAHAMYDLIAEAPGRPLLLNELFQRSRAYEVAPDPEDPSRDKPLRRH
jgi:hypothetical protein